MVNNNNRYGSWTTGLQHGKSRTGPPPATKQKKERVAVSVAVATTVAAVTALASALAATIITTPVITVASPFGSNSRQQSCQAFGSDSVWMLRPSSPMLARC